MFAVLLAISFSSKIIQSLNLKVTEGGRTVFEKDIIPGNIVETAMNESSTLTGTISGDFSKSMKYQNFALENGAYSITGSMTYRNNKLSFVINPAKLEKLYKHAGIYNLRIVIHDQSLDEPLIWTVAKIDYKAIGEDKDNFTDVEWDFQPAKKQPKEITIKVFTYATYLPLAVLVILLLKNGFNLGYFPRSLEALPSLAFIAGFGGFLYYFIIFWKQITFEEMLLKLCMIIPILAILLRYALIGRSKMVLKNQKTENKVKTE